MKRVATFGDVHGSIEELELLYSMLCWESLDEIRHAGDLVDRGPDSGSVVAFCREYKINGIMGNHDAVLLNWYERNELPRNPDKRRSTLQITDKRDWQYLKDLPNLHIDDEIKTVFVHGGVYPNLAWELQPDTVTRLQMCHPEHPGKTRWYYKTRDDVLEETLREQDWKRWYEVYDHEYNVVYGHTAHKNGPRIDNNLGFGLTIGVDTGCNWTGMLTAIILPDVRFISTPRTKDLVYTIDNE